MEKSFADEIFEEWWGKNVTENNGEGMYREETDADKSILRKEKENNQREKSSSILLQNRMS